MSRFLRVKCKCGNEQNIFGHASREVYCLVCKYTLAFPKGSRVKLNEDVKVIKVL
jgi:small subunit ribosomal protein S27e